MQQTKGEQMNDDTPLRLLTTAAIARRFDKSHPTIKRRLIEAGARADALQLPAMHLLYSEDRLEELRAICATEPAPLAVETHAEVNL